MTNCAIVTYGEPILRKTAKRVVDFGEDLFRLLDNMFETMANADGIGLAANQIGDDRHVLVIDTPLIDESEEPMVLINAKIVNQKGKQLGEEGCLSLPGLRLQIERATEITIEYQNENGERVTGIFYDLLARVVQHEVDHLNGLLMIDRVGTVTKAQIKNQLEEMKSQSNN